MDKLSGQRRGQVWKRSLLYILLGTQNRSLALCRHATSPPTPPPPQGEGKEHCNRVLKRSVWTYELLFLSLIWYKKAQMALSIHFKQVFYPISHWRQIYCQFEKKLTAYHFLEGAKPVVWSMAQGACWVQIKGRKLSTRLFKIINEAPVINTCGLLHIALSVFLLKTTAIIYLPESITWISI